MNNLLMLSAMSFLLAEEPVATNGMMDTFNMVWGYVQPIVTSATFGTIFTAIIVAILKGTISKKFSKINFDERFEQMADMAFKRLQGMTFKHDIEPLVESHLAKIKQELTLEVEEKIEQVKCINLMQANLISDFAKFFENSNGIPSEVKDKFNADLEAINEFGKKSEPIIVESTPLIEEKHEKKHNKEVER